MEIILQIASAAAFYIFLFFMFERLYPRKNFNFRQRFLIIAGTAVLMIVVGLIQEPMLNFIYSLLSMLLLNKMLYAPKGKSFVIYDTILLIIMMAIEMVSVSLFAFTINKELHEVLDNVWYTSASTVMNWLLMFIAFRIYIFLISRKEITSIKTQEFVFFLMLISGEIFFLHFINDILVSSKTKHELTVILTVFLLLDLYLAFLMYKISKSHEIEKKYDLVKQQSQLQLSAYKELNEKYNASRKVIHDVKKHISLLEGLINSSNSEAAEKYKNMLNAELDRLVPQFECDSPILTVIINDKLAVAEIMNIDFKLNVEFSELGFISELDITSIFSNLLDNAFEACLELPQNKRYVSFSVTRHNYFLLIYLENAYKSVDVDENHRYKSTKSNYNGIGLSNVKNAVDKYEGHLDITTENGLFESKILIPISENILFKSN